MIKIHGKQKLQILIFIFLIIIISFLAFWRALSFDFWGEDWEQLWEAAFDPAKINNFLELREHAIVIYEELFLSKFLGFNTFYWQIVGYLLKVLSAFAVSLMMLGFTRSKRVAFFTGLIYASSVGGLASFTWVAAHSSALVIPSLCLGIYFWIIKRNFVLALVLLIFSFWADPSRGFFGSMLVIFWEILSILQFPQQLKKSGTKIFILLTTLFFTYFIFQFFYNFTGKVSVGYNLNIVFSHLIRSLNNFLTNLGNLLVGWIIPIPQNIFAISLDNFYGRITGYLFLIQTIYLYVNFLKRRTESLKTLLFFSIWIPFFFLPNWLLPDQEMIQNGRVLGATHRYLTLSAVGLACYLGYALTRVKNNYLKYFLLFFVVLSNVLMSNQILKKESYYRSAEVTKPMWDKIEKDVPPGEENSLFFIRGEDRFRVNDISQARFPFAIQRGIQSFDKLPASTSDPGVVKRYLCGNNESGRIIPLSHLHGWYIKGNTVDDISEKVRREFSEIDCSSQQY